MALMLTYLNYRGLDVVGNTAILLCIISVLPLAAFCVIGAFQIDPGRWQVQPPNGLADVDWKLFLNTFFWNINYWESSACYAGDVKNPGRTYPTALAWAVALVALSTFVPILVGTGASASPYTSWDDGYLSFLAVEVGGQWLGTWMTIGAMVSSVGMFVAEMSSDSWQASPLPLLPPTSSNPLLSVCVWMCRLPAWQSGASFQSSWALAIVTARPPTASYCPRAASWCCAGCPSRRS